MVQLPLLLTVREVALLLRINRPKVYYLIKDGVLRGFKLGSDWRVKTQSVEQMIGTIPVETFSSITRGRMRQ